MQEFVVIFEDEDLLILNKPALLSVQNEGDEPSLESILKEKYSFIGIIHRLDQRVSGLILIAKNEKTLAILNKDFQERKISKKYLAIIANKPRLESEELVHWIQKSKIGNKVKAFPSEVRESKKAILTYKTLATSNRYSLLEIELATGRFHQIRAQLAAIGSPIVGDLKYGFSRSSVDSSIFLQSNEIKFEHPSSHETCHFTIEKPVLWSKFGF